MRYHNAFLKASFPPDIIGYCVEMYEKRLNKYGIHLNYSYNARLEVGPNAFLSHRKQEADINSCFIGYI